MQVTQQTFRFHITASISQAWGKAKVEERREVIGAFRSNKCVDVAGFAGAHIDDPAGMLWATVLCTNSTLTSLNLESNEMQSGAIEAIARALAQNSTLRELKLANQRKNFRCVLQARQAARESRCVAPITIPITDYALISRALLLSCVCVLPHRPNTPLTSQVAEERLAEGLEANTTITRLSIDLRSTHARDRINKTIDRNQAAARQAGRLHKANPNPPMAPLPGSHGQAASNERAPSPVADAPAPLDHSAALQRTAKPQRKPRSAGP